MYMVLETLSKGQLVHWLQDLHHDNSIFKGTRNKTSFEDVRKVRTPEIRAPGKPKVCDKLEDIVSVLYCWEFSTGCHSNCYVGSWGNTNSAITNLAPLPQPSPPKVLECWSTMNSFCSLMAAGMSLETSLPPKEGGGGWGGVRCIEAKLYWQKTKTKSYATYVAMELLAQ